jgi:hypothetical protein
VTTAASGAVDLLAERAEGLPVAERVLVVERYFAAHPGPGREAPGYGRALLDVLSWQLRSGRVADTGGSRWWRVVNGVLVLALSGDEPALAAPWRRYEGAGTPHAQAAWWRAHDASIAAGTRLAAPLLAAEPEAERRFVARLLAVLDEATRHLAPSDTPALGRAVARDYPRQYPATPTDLAALDAALSGRRRAGGP